MDAIYSLSCGKKQLFLLIGTLLVQGAVFRHGVTVTAFASQTVRPPSWPLVPTHAQDGAAGAANEEQHVSLLLATRRQLLQRVALLLRLLVCFRPIHWQSQQTRMISLLHCRNRAVHWA